MIVLFSKLKASKSLIAGVLIGGILGSVGVAAAIAPHTAGTIYYACLSKGNLSKVGLVSGTCKSGQLISWNSLGPLGPQGQVG